MQGQQAFFDKLMAKAALAAAALQASFETQLAKATLAASEQMAKASDQKASFEHQMAKAELTMGSMKIALKKLECENADQKKTAAQVRAGGVLRNTPWCMDACLFLLVVEAKS